MSSGLANKRWCQEHPVNRRKNQKRFITSPKGIYFRLKNQAREHRRDFNINFQDYLTWLNHQPKVCHYCGNILIPHGHNGDCQTVDRVDNNKGYELANMVLACVSCNTKKGNKERIITQPPERAVKMRATVFSRTTATGWLPAPLSEAKDE